MFPSLRDTIEDLRRSLQPKKSAIEALQQLVAEKEQVQMICLFSLLKCLFDLDLLYVYLMFFLADV